MTKSVQTETLTHSSTQQPEVIQTARCTRTPAAGDTSSTNRLLATGSRPVRDHSDQNRCFIQTVKFLTLNKWEFTDETPADLYSEGVTGNRLMTLPSLSSLQLKHDFNFKFRLCRLILMFNSFYGRLASMKEP